MLSTTATATAAACGDLWTSDDPKKFFEHGDDDNDDQCYCGRRAAAGGVYMSCVSKSSHVTRRRRKKRKMGCGNNNNAMQSAAIVPASATTRFANHTTFSRFTKTVKKSMLYRPELSNASCLVLPKQFWVQYGKKIRKSISLRRLSGEEWPVRVWSDQKLTLISAGWKLFSIKNVLEVGDEITFILVSPTCFLLQIHDHKSGHEKTIPTTTTATRTTYSIHNRN